jgi:hypothetical protein
MLLLQYSLFCKNTGEKKEILLVYYKMMKVYLQLTSQRSVCNGHRANTNGLSDKTNEKLGTGVCLLSEILMEGGQLWVEIHET